MSGTPISTVPPRKSFAQVAAAANRPIVAVRNDQTQTTEAKPKKQIVDPQSPTSPLRSPPPPALPLHNKIPNGSTTVAIGMNKLDHSDTVVEALRASILEDKSAPLSASSEGLLKKDNSDTKSVTSRTTLTLDEKESLRPDDSASMQAAIEEDTFSPSGSVVATSGRGSDPDAHAFRAQLNEISLNDNSRVVMPRAQRPQGLGAVEQRGLSMQPGTINFPAASINNGFVPPHPPVVDGSRPPATGMWVVPPDEKLMEALASPKDRLFVLKVEQDFIDFIKDPNKEQTLQLPGTNSFYRMLSHKLADYYMLGHVVDDSMSSVKVYRTPNCRLPPPLIGSTPGTNNSTPPPSAQTRQIMRRGRGRANGANDSNFDSFNSSKATSDIGSGEDKNCKGALTREERENRYKETRARIFKDFESQQLVETAGGQAEPDISRSSSTSGVKKNKKRGKYRDDGFEARSAFDPYGRRLSDHAYAQLSPDGAYDQYNVDSTKQYGTPNGVMMQHPAGYPVMGYNGPNGNAAPQMNPWTPQHAEVGSFQNAQYGISTPPYGRGAFPANPGFDGMQFGSPVAADHTPKGTAPMLSGYGQTYAPQTAQMHWSPQESYANPYASPMYPQYQSYGQDYAGYYPNQMMTPIGPGGYVAYPNHPPQNFFPEGYDQSQGFNPRSQAFVPGMHGSSGNGQFVHPQSMPFVPNPVFPPQPQRQPSNTINQASFNASQHGMNGRAKGAVNNRPSNIIPGSQQSSLAKWAAPANLPAKPPQPLNGLPSVENAQSLPPKPIPSG